MRRIWVALLVYWAQLPLYAGYLTDDSFIYAQFARNLARHGQLAFNLGEPVHAATSPLWAALGAVGVLLGLDPFWFLKALGVLCASAALALFGSALQRLRVAPGIWWLSALGLATQPWFVRWSASGMETALAALCVVGALHALLGPRARRDAVLLGLAGGLGPLVRPELWLFALLLAWIALRDARLRPIALPLLALPTLLVEPLLWSHSGRWLPATVGAKSTDAGLVLSRFVYNLRVMGQIVAVALGLPLLLALVGWWRERRLVAWRSPLAGVLPWILLLPAIYLLRDVQLISRYLEIWTPLVALCIAAQLRPRRAVVVLWSLQILLALGLSAFRVAPSTRAFSHSIDRALGDLAAWLRDHSQPDDLVAVYDIGLVGYRSERRILDLGGLIEPEIARLRRLHDDEAIVREGLFLQVATPRYLIHRAAQPDALADREWGGLRPRPILSREVANLGVSRAQPVHYTLYELR